MQIAEATKLSRTVLDTLQQVIVGKEQVLQHLLLGLYSGGNILIEDFPGLAKTLTARLLAQVTGLDFKRIQFTPDLLPGDITGGVIYNQKRGEFEFRRLTGDNWPELSGELCAGGAAKVLRPRIVAAGEDALRILD